MELKHKLGLDLPLSSQYINYWRGVVKGDLGVSLVNPSDRVLDKILVRYPATLELAIAGLVVALLISIPLGVTAGVNQGRLLDNLASVIALLGISTPGFVLGPLMIYVFAIKLDLLPVSGRYGPEYLILPAVTMGAALAAILTRMVRSSVIEELNEDYVRTARAKGLSERQVIYKHVLKNGLIPVVTIIGLQFGVLLAGAIITEIIFSWPGLGRLTRLKPAWEHPFGLDDLGRDVLSRVIYGARISMQVGVMVVLISALIGMIIGSVSGYYGGWIDRIFSGFLFNVFLAFPSILLAIAMVAFLGPSIRNLILALSVIGWVGYARLIRGQVLKVREFDYVTAARALGASDFRILFRHILPNAIQPLIVQASLGMAGAVLSEASLSFLGLGVQPPTSSWGVMLNDARSYLNVAPHLLIFPGIAVMLTVLAFNFVGDGLREWLDPKQNRSN
ncbi:MAG: ABC transporter permease subunit [Acidobacteria bacterium]|nr:ABC transporter permease subunit [Acidobacteriota bacterium]